jgi:putative copper resistance protein D
MLTAFLVVARAIHIAASILIAGSFTFDVIVLRSLRLPVSHDLCKFQRTLMRWAIWALVAALVSAVVWLWIEVLSMSGLSVVDCFSTSAWNAVLFETVFGRVWQLRLGILGAALALACLESGRKRKPGSLVVLALFPSSIVLLGSLAWISHAAANPVQPLNVIADMLHLCAAGVWIGGFVPLAICLSRASLSSVMAKASPLVLSRFSTLTLFCVSVVIVTGISNSWFLVGSVHALFTTDYGRLLLVKLALFGLLIYIGARNRVAIKAAWPTAETPSYFLQQLRRNVIGEICLSAAVLGIVACMGVTPPAWHS